MGRIPDSSKWVAKLRVGEKFIDLFATFIDMERASDSADWID